MKSALIIFVRNPVLGQVKTRIAKDLGNEATLDIYKILLAHTRSVTCNLKADVFVYYADFIKDYDLWDKTTYNKKLQSGSDLGERMKNAFADLQHEGYSKICIIGSDCFELTANIIEEAFQALTKVDTVIGPSYDGGYYLLGLSKLISSVFEQKEWSSDSVYRDTINDLISSGFSYYALPTLSDVDTIEDCKKYNALLAVTQ